MPRDGTKNLIPTTARSEKEVKEMQKKGGIKSGEARRKKRTKRQLLELLLNVPPNSEAIPESVKSAVEMIGIDLGDIQTNDELLAISLYANALSDIQHHKYLDEIMGRNPQLELKKREVSIKEKMIKQLPGEDSHILEKLSLEELEEVLRLAKKLNENSGG